MKFASLGPIAVHLPPRVETNEQLQAMFPQWDMALIEEKTGIQQRHIAAPDQCASDLGVAAARQLLDQYDVDPSSIDFLLLCTQTPDYPLPTTACMMQDRLGLPTHCGALDFNLGCSGFVYGLALANGLIASGSAHRILLITAETYSRYIHDEDRSLRTIFGDGAAASLIVASEERSMEAFQFGTDGSGANTLMVNSGGARLTKDALRPRYRQRWKSALYMDGPGLLSFTVAAVPELVEKVLAQARLSADEVDLYIMHQATFKMLEQLRQRLQLSKDRLPLFLQDCGNTVSSTIPIAIERLRKTERLKPDAKNMLVGFGVGWSWAGCIWRDNWRPNEP